MNFWRHSSESWLIAGSAVRNSREDTKRTLSERRRTARVHRKHLVQLLVDWPVHIQKLAPNGAAHQVRGTRGIIMIMSGVGVQKGSKRGTCAHKWF